jgi:hypothetical protein
MSGIGSFRPLACAALLLAGCAATPTPVAEAPPPAGFSGSGLVIGTLSYHYVEAGTEPDWVVHFDRIDAPARQEYALHVDVDPDNRKGVFTGALPAGVYAFREAASDNRRFATGTLGMPFEVQPGQVRDAGHYTLNPVVSRR